MPPPSPDPAPPRGAPAVMVPLAKLLVRVFFRDLEVQGTIAPATTPTVLVANHHNGLVDGLVLIAASARYPHFLGKSTLWRVPLLRPFLSLAGVVAVLRAADAGAGATDDERHAENEAAFARCRELLAGGRVVAVFPEGISHDRSGIAELRTGAARIALGAAAGDDVRGLVVQPVGLVYDNKTRFRSGVLASFGPPVPVAEWVEGYRHDPPAATRSLTHRIATALRATAPDFPDAGLASEVLSLAAIAGPDPITGAPRRAEQEAIARALSRLTTANDDPAAGRERIATLAEAAARYRADLALLGVEDSQLVVASGRRRRAGIGLRVVAAAVAVPLAVVGIGAHAVPYSIMRVLGRLPRNASMRATVKLLGSFGLYLVTYATIGIAVGRRRGWRRGALAAAVAPVSGYVAILTGERIDRADGARQAAIALGSGAARVGRLRRRRAELVVAIREAAEAGRRYGIPMPGDGGDRDMPHPLSPGHEVLDAGTAG